MNQLPDLRPSLTAAQDWVGDLIVGIRDDQWAGATPCTEFDVKALVEHLLAVQERIRRMAAEGGIGDAPRSIDLPEAGVAEDFRARARAGQDAWAGWDLGDLSTRAVVAPFGQVPGAVAVIMYTNENLVHGWDLAVATGQDAEAPAGLSEPVFALVRTMIPTDRGGDLPFGPVVESLPGAGPTERLANWMGRSR